MKRDLLKALAVVSAVGVFYLAFVVSFTYEPPVGQRMVLKKRQAEAQETGTQPFMGLVPGTVIADPKTGKMYRVHSSSTSPQGFVICPNGIPVTHNPTELDLIEATECRDGHPFRPQDREAEGINTPCTAGTVVHLCGRPGSPQEGQKMESLTPSDDEYRKWEQQRGHWMPPEPSYTEPHSWLHLEWGVPKAYSGFEIAVPKAWAVTRSAGSTLQGYLGLRGRKGWDHFNGSALCDHLVRGTQR